MTLAALIRKSESVRFATATSATVATLEGDKVRTVATVATVSVANPPKTKTVLASRWWLVHYPDGAPVEVWTDPPATHAEILERHQDTVAAEPFTPTIWRPSTPMTAEQETAIRAWLTLIEETDKATNAEVIGQCQRDADARDYFTGRAAAELNQKEGK